VEGSIRREGSRVRIAAQLIRASDQYPRWTKNFDRNLSDIISLETEVASDIASEIQSSLGSTAPLQPLSSSPVVPGAHDAYLRGMSESDFRSQEGFNQVVAAFRDAVAMDPKSQQAWTGLASTYDYAGNYGLLAPRSAFTQAKAAAQKAIELDPNSPDAYIYLADSLVTLDLDWKQAEYEIHRALVLNPNDASAHDWHGLFLFLSGRADEGILEMRHAWQLDPLSTERMLSLGSSLFLTGKVDDAATIFQMATSIRPENPYIHEYLGYIYERQEKFEPAIKEWATAYRLMGQKDTEPAMLQAYATSGFTAAKELGLKADIQHWTALRNKQYEPTYQIARDYALLGDKEHSIMWLEKTFQERDAHLLCLRRDSKNWFVKVSDDPRFMAIIKKIGYPDEQHSSSSTAAR
jgi:Flp pilus assembly protein TadD